MEGVPLFRFGECTKIIVDFFEKTDTDIIKIMNENLVPEFGEIRTPEGWNKIPEAQLKGRISGKIKRRCRREGSSLGIPPSWAALQTEAA